MQKKIKSWSLVQGVTLLLLGTGAAAQSPPPFAISSVPTGLRPLGLDITYQNVFRRLAYVVVANSSDNSVSFLRAIAEGSAISVLPEFAITGIPSPYAVSACPTFSTVLVSSPTDNSVRVLGSVPSGIAVVGTVQVGPQPHSVACFRGPGDKVWGAVSNTGDNSLVVFDVETLTVIASIPNVPASRGFQGVRGVSIPGTGSAAELVVVAGTDANVVTTISLATFSVLNRTPVDRPTAINESGNSYYVAGSGGNEILIYNPFDAGLASRYINVPNPQDVVGSGLGFFSTIGGQNSLSYWRRDDLDSPRTVIRGIPGAAALAVAADLVYCFDNLNLNCLRVSAVMVTSTSSNSVFLIQLNQAPVPPPSGSYPITNGASFSSQVSPGSLGSALVEIGASLAFHASAFGEPLPRTLGGVTLKIGGSLTFDTPSNQWVYSSTGSIDAPLHFVGPSQINFQVPTGIAPGSQIPAQLIRPDGSTLLTTFNITPTAPGIFTVLQNGQGQGAVLHSDFSQNGLPQLIVGARPARRGEEIQIYATGGGETDPPLLPGEPAPASGNPLVVTRVQPSVTIGGQQARVLFSGMAPGWVGLWQINAEIPPSTTPGAAVPLSISAGGVMSNTVTIAVE